MTTEKKTPVARRKRLPRFCKATYLCTALSAGLYLAFVRNAAFADWFNRNVSRWGRRILSYLTVWLPFSFAELLVILLPLLLALCIVIAWRHYCDSWRSARVFSGILLSVVCAVGILFVWCFAPGYYGTTLDEKLGLNREDVSAEELSHTAALLWEEMGSLTEDLLMPPDASSVMPYSLDEMNEKLMRAYDSFTEKQDYPDHFYSRVKPIMLSRAMSYTHITGVYSFFTGEANINTNFPDYTIPFTAAHELAHQRGVAREDEANFIAFLICMESDDPYIRYSGLLNVWEYVSSALYSADPALWREAYLALPQRVLQEEKAYDRFFDKYRENIAATVSDATNNAYLQSQGAREGSRSYDMVVDLAVAYFRPFFD